MSDSRSPGTSPEKDAAISAPVSEIVMFSESEIARKLNGESLPNFFNPMYAPERAERHIAIQAVVMALYQVGAILINNGTAYTGNISKLAAGSESQAQLALALSSAPTSVVSNPDIRAHMLEIYNSLPLVKAYSRISPTEGVLYETDTNVLQAILVLRVALDHIGPEMILKAIEGLRKNQTMVTMGQRFRLPNGSVIDESLVLPLLSFYIVDNVDKFASFSNNDIYKEFVADRHQTIKIFQERLLLSPEATKLAVSVMQSGSQLKRECLKITGGDIKELKDTDTPTGGPIIEEVEEEPKPALEAKAPKAKSSPRLFVPAQPETKDEQPKKKPEPGKPAAEEEHKPAVVKASPAAKQAEAKKDVVPKAKTPARAKHKKVEPKKVEPVISDADKKKIKDIEDTLEAYKTKLKGDKKKLFAKSGQHKKIKTKIDKIDYLLNIITKQDGKSPLVEFATEFNKQDKNGKTAADVLGKDRGDFITRRLRKWKISKKEISGVRVAKHISGLFPGSQQQPKAAKKPKSGKKAPS